LAKLGDERGVTYLERPKSWREEIAGLFEEDSDDAGESPDAFAGLAARDRMLMASALGEARSVLTGPTVQVRCLSCPAVAPSRVPAADRSLLERFLAWAS
jgi:protease-4